MYKVLLADDERIIREGMARSIRWDRYGTVLQGVSADGREAYAMITADPPDIVIADIKMPVMDGLELLRRVRAGHPHMEFIILSGYGEFDYAAQAMELGVEHYLLKPCGEGKVGRALTQVVEKLRRRDERAAHLRQLQERLERVLPHVKEQFVKDFVTSQRMSRKEFSFYWNLFGLGEPPSRVRLLLMRLEGEFSFERLIALKSLAEQVFEGEEIQLGTTFGEHVLLLVQDGGDEAMVSRARRINEALQEYHGTVATIAVSDPGPLFEAPSLFQQTRDLLEYRFYTGEGSVITRADVAGEEQLGPETGADEERIGALVRSGNVDAAAQAVDAFFDRLVASPLETTLAKAYSLELYSAIARQSPPEEMDGLLKGLAELAAMDTLDAIRARVREVAVGVAERRYQSNVQQYNRQVAAVIEAVERHLEDKELSLRWLAKQLFYMNEDYLGKLFKQATGERFSEFVARRRVEKAKELLLADPELRVYEVADRVGFGDNPQYFSQVFRKYTGCSPSEYRDKCASSEI